MYMPGFGGGQGSPELNVNPWLVSTIVQQMRAFRRAVGDGVGLKLDLNYNFRTDGFLQVRWRSHRSHRLHRLRAPKASSGWG